MANATGKVFYLSGTGNDSNTGLSTTNAFRSFEKVRQVLKAGDTVYVMNGIYSNLYPNSSILSIKGLKGTAERPTVIKAYPGHKPVLEAHSNNWNAVSIIGSSHVVVDGLTLRGARDEITLEYALQQKNNLQNPATSGNGIQVTYLDGPNKTEAEKIHSTHITLHNNTVSNFPGGGIGTTEADYITIENNIVSGNSYYSPYGNQGITNLRLWNSDNNTTGYKVIIQGNTVFDNEQKVPWFQANGVLTEGHGIMLDTSVVNGVYYTGKALIANNTSYNNGGVGIVIFQGKNPVDIINNTTYQNGRVLTQAGEIEVLSADNVRVYNNILFARGGKRANAIYDSSNVIFDRNLVYNSTQFQASDNSNATSLQNILGQDPLFVAPAEGNFSLHPNSPAIDRGSSLFSSVVKVDQRGRVRPQDGDNNGSTIFDIGAIEVVSALTPGAEKSRNSRGSSGNDVLTGTQGKDRLVGNGGDDQLVGFGDRDILTGGIGADRFIYSGKTQRDAFSHSQINRLDRITDFNVTQGDRIQLDYDRNLKTIQRPKRLFNAGKVSEKNLTEAVKAAYADKNQRSPSKQKLLANEAVIFRFKNRTYLSVNNTTQGFSPSQDLVIDVTGIQTPRNHVTAGVLPVNNYFV